MTERDKDDNNLSNYLLLIMANKFTVTNEWIGWLPSYTKTQQKEIS